MSRKASFLILGSGGSMGIPVIGCRCDVCRSSLPENKRLRPSGLLTVGEKRILVDCTPDYRTQALKHGIEDIDGVIFTHAHQDHIGGIDDLRMHYLWSRKPLPTLMSEATERDVKGRFPYLFSGEAAKTIVAKLEVETFPEDRGALLFEGIPLHYMTYEQCGMPVNGLRFGEFAYISDIRDYPETLYEDLEGVQYLVVSALRMETSHIHFSVDEAVAFGERIGAEKVWLTHIAHELEHKATNAYLPENVRLAYDGLEISFEVK